MTILEFRVMALCLTLGLLGGCQPPAGQASAPPSSQSAPERRDAQASGPASGFAAMDADGDGVLAPAEHASAAGRMFRQMDADQNGEVTPAEMELAQPRVGGGSPLSAADKIKVIDLNGDGRLSKVEHAEGSRTMFAKMDVNADGALSRGEFEAGHKAMLGG